MDTLRKAFDAFYDLTKPIIFHITKNDPEIAHNLFINSCKFLHKTKLEKIILNNKSNRNNPSFTISTAAGFNKNAEIPPQTLEYLGFNRIVIGTITYQPWKGNQKPRTKRIVSSESLINWIGLSNEGAIKIAERLSKYPNSKIPITSSIAPTPNKKENLNDLEKTIILLRDNPNIDRFELNISCPSIKKRYNEEIREISMMVKDISSQDLYLKISPDLTEKEIDNILINTENYVKGFVTTNSSTDSTLFPSEYIKGGISGNALYDKSLHMQKLFYKKIKDTNLKLIACGGINSTNKIKERLSFGAKEIQIYTPIIFSGTKLLRKFRNY